METVKSHASTMLRESDCALQDFQDSDLQPQVNFAKILTIVAELEDYLKCVICGQLPEMLYVTGCCEHKYCKACSKLQVEGKLCSICDARLPNAHMKSDLFCHKLNSRLTKLKKILEKAAKGETDRLSKSSN